MYIEPVKELESGGNYMKKNPSNLGIFFFINDDEGKLI
jgi:hypothetical protein